MIVNACRRGDRRLTIGFLARAAEIMNALSPGAFAACMSIVAQLLPAAGMDGDIGVQGSEIRGHSARYGITDAFLIQNNEVPVAEHDHVNSTE
jgi:hypothetical protein